MSAHAITAASAGTDLSSWRDVWVFVELEHGKVQQVAFELLGEGRKLADVTGSRLAGVVLGPPDAATEGACAEAIAYGADRVYVITDPVLSAYRNQPFARGLEALVRRHRPAILLLGATVLGRDLAGSVATLLGTGLTADCTELAIDTETSCLAADRPTFGGSLLCTIQILDYRPQMATIRPRVMAIPARREGRHGEIIRAELGMAEDDIATKVLEFRPEVEHEAAQLPFADFVVSGGRGLGNADNLKLLWTLADVLGGEVGATRPLVTSGWMPAERQVGQTGKTVRPKLYVAAGVSGAIQHRVGMENSDVILAINTDPKAPIFEFATHGVVADAVTLLPELAAAIEARLAESGKAGEQQ